MLASRTGGPGDPELVVTPVGALLGSRALSGWSLRCPGEWGCAGPAALAWPSPALGAVSSWTR